MIMGDKVMSVNRKIWEIGNLTNTLTKGKINGKDILFYWKDSNTIVYKLKRNVLETDYKNLEI